MVDNHSRPLRTSAVTAAGDSSAGAYRPGRLVTWYRLALERAMALPDSTGGRVTLGLIALLLALATFDNCRSVVLFFSGEGSS